MKNIKSHFVFNRQQRSGIFFLLFFIIIFQCAYFFIDFSYNNKIDQAGLNVVQRQIDSLKRIKIDKPVPKMRPFNPNYLDDFKGYSLGMTNEQIDNLLAYRKTGKYINSPEAFKEVTGVSDSLLTIMTPYFSFPDWINKKKKIKKLVTHEVDKSVHSKGINEVLPEDLIKVKGIGVKLSERIVKYRKRLGGFVISEQLYEVYGLKKEVADNVLKAYPLRSVPVITKFNINEASLKELSSLVYLNYNEALNIINFRTENGKIENFADLIKIEGFSPEKINKIELYLTLD